MNNRILNREGQLPQDNFYMVAKKGDFPVVVKTATAKNDVFIQVIDDKALASMANRFIQDKVEDPSLELLVDQDHFSDNEDKPSQAFGWIQNLQNRDDGLWAQISWTDEGSEAVKNKRYRFLSPVWEPKDCEKLGNRRIRPLRLDKAAVTNEPNIKGMVPLKNRQSPDTGGKESNMDPKKELLGILGLNADATDDQITAGIAAHNTEIQNRKTELETIKNRVTEMEKKELEALVEADLNTHKDKIANRDAMKALLIKNREDGLKLIAAMAPLPLALSGGQTPENLSQEQKIKNRKASQDTLIDAIMNDSRCSSRAHAYELARSRQPDLFV